MQPITQIMCVTGPSFDAAPKWTQKTRHDVGQVPTKIKQAVRRFLTEKEFTKPAKLPAFDYWTVLDALTNIPEHDHATETVEALGHDLGPEFVQGSHRIHEYLSQRLPVATVKRVGGAKNVLPNTVDILRFRHTYRLALEPLAILDDLESGSITTAQIQAIKDLWPDLYQDIEGAIFEGIAQQSAKKKDFGLPYRKDLVLQTFLQASTMTPALAKDLQATFKKAPPKPSGPSKSLADQIRTPIQKSQNL